MDHAAWNQFVLEHGPRSGRFLQSWEWGGFQTAVGGQVRRGGFDDEDTVTGMAQWLERKLPGSGIYRYCPKGPIGEGQLQGGRRELFLRIEPESPSLLQGAEKSVDLSPAHTRITSLADTEEALLAGMHSK